MKDTDKVTLTIGQLKRLITESSFDKNNIFWYISDRDNFMYAEVIECLRRITPWNLEVLYNDIEKGYYQRISDIIFGPHSNPTEEQEDALIDAVYEILRQYLEEEKEWSTVKYMFKNKIANRK